MFDKACLPTLKVYLYNEKQTMLLQIHRAFETSTLCLQTLYKDSKQGGNGLSNNSHFLRTDHHVSNTQRACIIDAAADCWKFAALQAGRI